MELDATAQADLVRRGEVKAPELVEAAIAAIEAIDPQLNAVIHRRFERAVEEALDPGTGPFAGVPFLAKDALCAIAGEPHHQGLRAARDAGYRAPVDSELYRRFRGAGFVCVGRTNVPELCFSATVEGRTYGACHNPWDLSRSTGGSSGGSAAANHLIHALRRNVNLTILLFNNQIYGLTKGQYSPTSEVGKVTKSTPFGSVDTPFNPISLALGAEATFVARTHDMDRKHMMETIRRAHEHRGAAFVEIYQNCNVFNDGAFEAITGKEVRPAMLIPLEDGKPIRFGAQGERGVMMQSDGRLRICEVAEVGEEALLVHDEAREPAGLAFQLSRLSAGPHEPTPIGVFRAVQRATYDELVQGQLLAAQERQGPGDLAGLLASGGTWEI